MKQALACRCPRCGKGRLFKPGFLSLSLNEACDNCGLELAKNDCGDGPAVFLIFILGALLVPMAIFVEFTFSPPLWVHAVVWGALALIITIGSLKPLKSYIIALQFKHRPGDWAEPKQEKKTSAS